MDSFVEQAVKSDTNCGSKFCSRSDVDVIHSTVIDECDIYLLATDWFRALTLPFVTLHMCISSEGRRSTGWARQ